MTSDEIILANALLKCSFIPGSFDKKFVKQLPNWANKEMRPQGRAYMIKLFHKYRRQIRRYKTLCEKLEILKKDERPICAV